MRGQQSMLGADLAGEVSTGEAYIVEPEGPQRFTVAAIDLGIKTNTRETSPVAEYAPACCRRR